MGWFTMRESVEAFIARGGTVKRCETREVFHRPQGIKGFGTAQGQANVRDDLFDIRGPRDRRYKPWAIVSADLKRTHRKRTKQIANDRR